MQHFLMLWIWIIAVGHNIVPMFQVAAHQAQVAAQSAVESAGQDRATGQITISAVMVYVLQALKKSKWFPLLQQQTTKLNRIAAVLVAGAAGIGIHTTYDHATGVLIITNLTMMGIVTGIWVWLKSFAVQEIIYQGAVNRPGNGNVPVPAGSAIASSQKGSAKPSTILLMMSLSSFLTVASFMVLSACAHSGSTSPAKQGPTFSQTAPLPTCPDPVPVGIKPGKDCVIVQTQPQK